MSRNFVTKILKEIRSVLVTIVVILIITFLLHAFVGRLVKVDGHSMDTNLANGDILFMDKITYKFRNPKRFEIVVFPHEKKLFIKRIIGLPGETVQIKEGKIYINGKILEENYGLEPIEPIMYGVAEVPVKLGDDEYFCMGDNRNHSGDSRLETVGNVHRDMFKGRAVFRISPFTNFGKLNY